MGYAKEQMGIVIRNNYVHDVYSSMNNNISFVYCDDTKDGVAVESNLIVNFRGRVMMINGGWDNTFRNNVLINCDTVAMVTAFGTSGQDRFNVNTSSNYDTLKEVYEYPAYQKYPHWNEKLEAIKQKNSPKHNLIENNVMINTGMDVIYALYTMGMDAIKKDNTISDSFAYALADAGFANIASEAYPIEDGKVSLDFGGFEIITLKFI